MLRWITVALLGVATAGCGDETVRRPLSIDVQGLSSRAERLIVQLSPGDELTCGQVNAANVTGLNLPIQLVWTRSSSAARRLTAPDIDDDAVTVASHSEDAAGAVLQLGCVEVDFLDIESPEVEIVLMSVGP